MQYQARGIGGGGEARRACIPPPHSHLFSQPTYFLINFDVFGPNFMGACITFIKIVKKINMELAFYDLGPPPPVK